MFPWSTFFDILPLFVIFPIFFLAFREFLDYRTRKVLIDKGVTPEEAKTIFKGTARKQSPTSLKWGLVMVLVGLAMVIIRIFEDVSPEVAFGLMFIAAGSGLLIYYFLSMKKQKESENKDSNDQKQF